MNFHPRLVTLVALLLVTAGCTAIPLTPAATVPTPAAQTPAAQTGDTLANTGWQLVSFGPPGAEIEATQGTTITLEFGASGQAGGESGCNSFGGTYHTEGDTLSFGQFASTLMACTDGQIMQVEEQYLPALQAANRFEISTDGLTIWYGAEGGVLTYAPASVATPAPIATSPILSTTLPAETLTPSEPPESIEIEAGATSAQRSSLLPSGPGIKQYLLTATAGQTLTVDATSDGVPLSMTIESPSGNRWIPEMRPVENGFAIGHELNVPEAGDYIVTLTKGDHTPSTNYTITFNLQ